MSKVENFLTLDDEHAIVNAIQEAERNTSGEIRIHIENYAKTDAYKRAKHLFYTLKMDNTKLQNAVLIYIAVGNKTFAIYGDVGITKAVGNAFWEDTKSLIETQFKAQHFKQGLIDGVLHIGEKLKTHFPIQHNDANELPNSISKS